MNRVFIRGLHLVIFSFICISGHCQSDVGSWSVIQLAYKANDRMVLKATPIMRTRNNLSDYNNTSLDISMHYKLNHKWSAMVLHRHFFLPDAGDRQFLFFQANYKQKLNSKWGLVHQFRYHVGLDINNRRDADFLRYLPRLTYQWKDWSTYIGFDVFYRIIDPVNLAGARYQAGCKRPLKNHMALNLQYWYQKGYSETPIGTSHLIVLILSKSFDHKKMAEKKTP